MMVTILGAPVSAFGVQFRLPCEDTRRAAGLRARNALFVPVPGATPSVRNSAHGHTA